jgi:hypothetical protein
MSQNIGIKGNINGGAQSRTGGAFNDQDKRSVTVMSQTIDSSLFREKLLYNKEVTIMFNSL